MAKIENKPKQVAAFNSSYILVAIFNSIRDASITTGIVRQSLIKAVKGELIASGGRYWRAVPEDFELEPDDLGKLSLFEFDESVGTNRLIYTTKSMTRHKTTLEKDYIKQHPNKY